MQNNRMVFLVLGLLMLALLAGAFVRYEVLKGRTMPGPEPISDFTSCLESNGGLDVTGTICTTASGQTYTKPGATLPDSTTSSTATTTPTPESTTTTTVTAKPLKLGTSVSFALNDVRALPDNSTISLDTIADSRCKPGVQCIWAGEFGTVWTVNRNGRTGSFNLSTVRTPSITQNGYTYALGNTTETSASLTVTNETVGDTSTTSTSSGTVTGTVTIGPVCPVESIEHPCVVPPETYTSRSVMVYAADNVTELERHPLDAEGRFTLTLKPGTYGLQIRPAGIGAGEIKPITVVADKVATIHFDVDTGIR
jgi:hypothetical protein